MKVKARTRGKWKKDRKIKEREEEEGGRKKKSRIEEEKKRSRDVWM